MMNPFASKYFYSMLLVLAIAFPAIGDDTVMQGRAMIKAERENIVRSELHMTEAEAAKFWPVYAKYRAEYDEVMEEYGQLIADYLRRYDDADLSNKYADKMLKSFFKNKEKRLALQKKYVSRFKAALPAMKVARFYQLENKFNIDIESQLSLLVPLVDPS